MRTYLRTVDKITHAAIATLLPVLTAAGCGGGGDTTTTTTTTTGPGGSGGSGGSGGAGANGGSGGAGATGGSGGAGGAEITCLPEAAYQSLFTIVAPDLCAVAVYTADATIAYQQPTWGDHGGPLLVEAGPAEGQVTLLRWTPPKGAEGAVTIAKTVVDAKIPAGAFVGGEALDLGFRSGTAISHQGMFPDTQGEMIVVDGSDTTERYETNGLFSMATHFKQPDGSTGRFLHTGLSPLGDNVAGANGLYAADDCAGDFISCAAGIQVAGWGDSSGPVVLDAQGNGFAVMTNFAGDQVARAFASATLAKGAAPTGGDVLFGLAGFGLGLAVIAPTDSAQGIVAFQPSDAMTFEALDVIELRYTATNDTVTAKTTPKTLFALPTPNTPVALLVDPQDRLWVGVPSATGTTFVVITRKPQ
jgi:hypothetical protein